jgi:excisionase family DNA binding protein
MTKGELGMAGASPVSVLTKEWLTLPEATQHLGKSEKSIERLLKAQELRSRLENREGRKPQRLYHAGDLERIKHEAIPASAVEPTRALAPAKPLEIAIGTNTVTTIHDVMTKWLDRGATIGMRERFWLTLAEAAEVSGIPRTYVKRLCEEGKIVSVRFGRAWRVRRASLEAFEG